MDKVKQWFMAKVQPVFLRLAPHHRVFIARANHDTFTVTRKIVSLCTTGRGARQELHHLRSGAEAAGAQCSGGVVLRPLPTSRLPAAIPNPPPDSHREKCWFQLNASWTVVAKGVLMIEQGKLGEHALVLPCLV